MSTNEQSIHTNLSGDHSDPFSLSGGRYGVVVNGNWNSGSLTLQILSADGVSWIMASTAITTDSASLLALPEGTYRLALALCTNMFATIGKIR